MDNQLPLIVKFEIKNEKLAYVKTELMKILEPTRKEKGCLLYELHQDLDNPNILMFYEIWETREAWKAHDNKQHILDFKKAIKGSVDNITVHKLTIL